MIKKQKKIFLFICSYPKSFIPFRGDLAKLLQLNNFAVHCAGPKPDKHDLKKITSMGIKYHELNINRNQISIISDIKLLFQIIRLIKNLSPIKILAYTIKPVVWTGIAIMFWRFYGKSIDFFALITGIGRTLQPNKNIYENLVSIVVKILYKISLRQSKTIIFQNNENYELFKKYNLIGKSESKIVPGSGVSILEFPNIPQNQNITSLKFLMVARIMKDKGILEFLECAEIIKKAYPDTEFNLAGSYDSNIKSDLKELVQASHYKKIINYLGEVDHSSILQLYKNCNVYILPSYHEGLPRSTLEAMSVGRAIITTNAPGCNDTVLEEYNGLKVNIKSSKDLADACKKMINNIELVLQMGINSRLMVEEKFESSKVNLAYLEIFK